MEHKLNKTQLSNESSNNSNIGQKEYNFPNVNNYYLNNDAYIELFYNSKNKGLNKNFPLNVIYNKRKTKNTK